MANLLISGASGFIGSWLTATLSRQGHSLYLLLRQPGQLPALRAQCQARGGNPAHLHALAGDLQQPGLGLDEHPLLARGISQIIHLGAQFAWGLPREQAERCNVAGSLALTQLASRLQAHLLLVGGFMLGNPAHLAELGIDPQHPAHSDWDRLYRRAGAYEASKLQAHYQSCALARQLQVPYNVVHPGTLCGHSQSGHLNPSQPLYELLDNLAQGRLHGIPGSPAHWLPLISVDLLVALLASLVERPLANGSELLALDPHSPSLGELLALLAEELDVAAPSRYVPMGLLAALLRLPGAERLLHSRRESLAFIRRERYDCTPLQAELQARQLVWPDLRLALRASARHYRDSRSQAAQCSDTGSRHGRMRAPDAATDSPHERFDPTA